jgi:hypothetical protein
MQFEQSGRVCLEPFPVEKKRQFLGKDSSGARLILFADWEKM